MLLRVFLSSHVTNSRDSGIAMRGLTGSAVPLLLALRSNSIAASYKVRRNQPPPHRKEGFLFFQDHTAKAEGAVE